MSRLAVVLMNLGGPDRQDAVRPFLFNLFKDPAILRLPAIARYPLAALISTTRTPQAKKTYAVLGGGSPILRNTEAQARALEAELAARGIDGARAFVAMSYWKPFVQETAQAVAAWRPDDVVLLPLYPQYSTTTTTSSFRAWTDAYRGGGRIHSVRDYPRQPGFIESVAEAIRAAWAEGGRPAGLRLLFSAHGLPQKIADAGDPYAEQVAQTAGAVAALLPEFPDWRICYQSRVGPLKWLEPAIGDELLRAAAEGRGVLVAPISFVSEHVETLVELDVEYAELARVAGAPVFLRARTPGVSAAFIAGLADLTAAAVERPA